MATATAELDTVAVLERPIAAEAEIPTANILPAARDFPEDAWVNLPNVPVFAEHTTTTKRGRELSFGRWELEAVCRNCNRRIRDTGDYAGLVVGHTRDPETAASAPPMPLVGLAGPFRMGLIRQPGGKAKWAILADFHVRREEADVLRRFPRRSPELWLEDSYEDMCLDPIALLGAEAPRLDMGLLYSALRRQDGREVEKYSACAPSATSVFVPGDKQSARQDYSAESSSAPDSTVEPRTSHPGTENNAMPFSPEDVKQIVDALEQQDWVQWVKSQMKAAPPVADAAGPPIGEPPAVPPLADAAAAPPTTPPAPPPEDNLPLKYSKLSGEVGTLRQTVDVLRGQLEEERGRRINTERYAALADCRRTRLFDLDAEFELVKYGRLSDEQFTAHVERISTNYREIPLDVNLPTFDLPAATSLSRPGGQKNRERYSKEVSDEALKIAKQKAMRGEPVSYEEVLEEVASGKA